VYERGVLVGSQSWAHNGTQESPASAKARAIHGQEADEVYFANTEGMIARSLNQAQRKIK
jgi:hypothetical protein